MRIAVAMSGGVDSSVAALLLKEEGHEVVGLSMQLWDHSSEPGRTGRCCTADDLSDARRVAWALDVPHYVLDLEREFAASVVRPFVESYLAGNTPIFGICLGHQLVGLALGGKTYKLKFGHHGGNHPVRQERTGKIEITAHNHNFAVDPDSLKQSEVEMTHFDLNDGTLEGLRHRTMPLFTVQYHPEASPGPHDSHYLFGDFVKMMQEWKS